MVSTCNRRLSIIIFLCIWLALLAGCLPASPLPGIAENQPTSQPTPLPQADVIFWVQVPENTPGDQSVHFEVVDEITGIPFNSQRYEMKRIDSAHSMVHMPLQLGDIVKYRYSLGGTPVQYEHGADGSMIRYRRVVISGINTYLDQVYSWDGEIKQELATGKIFGTVNNVDNQQPVADVFITVDGKQSISGANGEFVLENLPVGKHRLVIQEINNRYIPFQQEVVIADGAITPVDVKLTPCKMVKIAFSLTVPGNQKNLPIRFIGDSYSLGNLMSDQAAGMSVSASRAPFLVSDESGRYHLTLELPAGMLLRYKYSLGDGFWNAEHTPRGDYRIRQILVPASDAEIYDIVDQWNIGTKPPIAFSVHVPQNTPATDSISIQFSPYVWMPSLPMWSLGDGNWIYVLYSPVEWFKEMEYRFCRNDQCDETLSTTPEKMAFDSETELNEEISGWNDLSTDDSSEVSPSEVSISPRTESFVRGAALSSSYNPNWQPFINNGFKNLVEDHVNWVFLTPTWTVDDFYSPVMEPIPGTDPLVFDQYQMAEWAKVNQLHIAIYPQLNYSKKSLENWLPDETDTGWWERWFNRYQSFLIHHAIIASNSGAEALLLSDPLRNSPDLMTRIPEELYQTKWHEAIQKIRDNYQGKIMWAENYKSPLSFPSFIDQFDFIYVSYQGTNKLFETSQKDIAKQIKKILDKEIYKAVEDPGKPVILGLTIPSGTDDQNFMQPQADIYSAFLSAVNSRDWIAGVVTEGFHPAIESQDTSASIRGKPAEQIVKQYFSGFQSP